MRAYRYRVWIAILLAVVLAGCGGSGSSGFDNGPAAEDAAIRLALSEQRCVEHEAVEFCPADPRSPSVPGAPSVVTGLDGSGAIHCLQQVPGGSCTFTLPFVPEGFSEGAAFRVAARTLDPVASWTIGEVPAPPDQLGDPGLRASVAVTVPVTTTDLGARLQLAVLVFLTPPGSVPGTLKELTHSGADLIFVIPERVLVPDAPRTPTD